MQVTAESNYADMEEETNEIVYDTIVHGGGRGGKTSPVVLILTLLKLPFS